MRRLAWRLWIGLVVLAVIGGLSASAHAQTTLTWQEVLARFEANNPALRAGQIGVEESRATEITAYLRPNPLLLVTNDQNGLFASLPNNPFEDTLTVATFSYLHERQHKRELRRDSAQGATAIASSNQADLERTLIFNLRSAFVQTLQAKAFSTLAHTELSDYDRVLELSRARFQAGDIAQIDLDRLQLQRVQYESDVQTSDVNLRTAKIQLLKLLNDQTPIEQFDVTGTYDFMELPHTLDDLRRIALDTRPDLKTAVQAIEKARTDHRLAFANGSTDPTVSFDVGWPQSNVSYTPALSSYWGVGFTIPLRIFDRNQGEKLRTELDISRTQRLAEAVRAQVISDVDSAYATVMSNLALLRSYKATYLDQATRVRETVTFSYQRGGASLLDFLQAQQEYRTVQIAYVNLTAAYLSAVAQLNQAIGREVIP